MAVVSECGVGLELGFSLHIEPVLFILLAEPPEEIVRELVQLLGEWMPAVQSR